MQEATFSITVADQAPIGTPISIIYNVTSGGYSVTETFGATIGLIVEDWESGGMTQYNWSTGGNANWSVVSSGAYEGTYCAKSGTISHTQNTWLELEYDVSSADVISFMFKVSSESGYDYLRFLIDGNEQNSWSGTVGWDEATFDVSAGLHTFTWKYDKDYSVSSGSDCAWVDFIVLPAPPVTTAYAGLDDITCSTTPYQLQGGATLYEAINWTTSGSGSFDDSQLLDPVYTPSIADVENGEVTLTLTAFSSGMQVSDDMILTLDAEPVAFAGSDAESCNTMDVDLAEATAENASSIQWTTNGDGTFADDMVLNTTYIPGTNDIANGSVTLSLMAMSGGMCDDNSDDIVLTFIESPEAVAGSDEIICSDGTMELLEASATNYSSMEWTTSGDGSFNDFTAMNPVYTPGANDIASGSALLTFTAYGMGNCSESVSQLTVTIENTVMAFAGEDNTINQDETYTIADATAENFASVMWSTSGDGNFDDASATNPTYSPGTNDISNKEATLTMMAYGISPCADMMDDMVLSINTIGINSHNKDVKIGIFPNPNKGQFTLTINGMAGKSISYRIYSSLGNVVYEKENMQVKDIFSEVLDIDNGQGLYYIRVEGDDLLINEKMIIQK